MTRLLVLASTPWAAEITRIYFAPRKRAKEHHNASSSSPTRTGQSCSGRGNQDFQCRMRSSTFTMEWEKTSYYY